MLIPRNLPLTKVSHHAVVLPHVKTAMQNSHNACTVLILRAWESTDLRPKIKNTVTEERIQEKLTG
jgi:hypothetical protein